MSDLENDRILRLVTRMSSLNKRLAFTETLNDEFLDANRRIERSSFSDGTTVTVNWDKNTVEISPDLK